MSGVILVILIMRRSIIVITEKIKCEPFFLVTLAATLILSVFSRPSLAAIHWNVIAILFSQMLVCIAFEDCSLLSSMAELTLYTFKTPRKLGTAMVLITGMLAMLVTNDIALLTVVPLTIKMAKISEKQPYILIILETISANIFSAVTPFGNPQNLYLYSYYNISAKEFFSIMIPFGVFGAALLVLLTIILCRGEAFQIEKQNTPIQNGKLLAGSSFAFILNILAVLRVIDYRISLAVTLIIFLTFSPKSIKKADYILLLTFILFFLFSNSITSIPYIRNLFAVLLNSRYSVLLISAAVSQIISNVPAAVLLSGFTPYYRELLYGVSAGGLGTLIASLASLISYKLYIREYGAAKYLRSFLLLNFAFLSALLIVLLIIVKILD